jgi:hypothetical protein
MSTTFLNDKKNDWKDDFIEKNRQKISDCTTIENLENFLGRCVRSGSISEEQKNELSQYIYAAQSTGADAPQPGDEFFKASGTQGSGEVDEYQGAGAYTRNSAIQSRVVTRFSQYSLGQIKALGFDSRTEFYDFIAEKIEERPTVVATNNVTRQDEETNLEEALDYDFKYFLKNPDLAFGQPQGPFNAKESAVILAKIGISTVTVEQFMNKLGLNDREKENFRHNIWLAVQSEDRNLQDGIRVVVEGSNSRNEQYGLREFSKESFESPDKLKQYIAHMHPEIFTGMLRNTSLEEGRETYLGQKANSGQGELIRLFRGTAIAVHAEASERTVKTEWKHNPGPATEKRINEVTEYVHIKIRDDVSDEERDRINRQMGYSDDEHADIQDGIRSQANTLSPTPENAEFLESLRKAGEKDQQSYIRIFGKNSRAAAAAGALAATCGNILNSINNPASSPQSGDAVSSNGVLSNPAPPSSAGALAAVIGRLLEAANAEEFRAELANIRAELDELDKRIEDNNKSANKLFAQELDKAAQQKLENELAEQKAAVQVLLELCNLAEKLYVAERTNGVQKTLEALAELAQWIAPRLENEIEITTGSMKQPLSPAQEAENARTEELQNFFKEQISAVINNKYQVNLELRQTEAQTRLFDIFVDLVFKPVVSEKFLPTLQDISTFIQKAWTRAATIRLDETFQKIADENTKEAVERFCLQLEKISALPGLQIVMGWKTKLEVLEAERENQEINIPRTINACNSANEKLNNCNLPGMLTVWENLAEEEKQYQEIFIKKELDKLSVNELAEILNFDGNALPLDLRALVETTLKNKINELQDSGALQELPMEKLENLKSILSGAGLTKACGIVQEAIDVNKAKEQLVVNAAAELQTTIA